MKIPPWTNAQRLQGKRKTDVANENEKFKMNMNNRDGNKAAENVRKRQVTARGNRENLTSTERRGE